MDLPTILVAGIIGAAMLAVLIVSIVNKKKGKHSCSCGSVCSDCPMSGSCHSNK